MAVTIAQVQKSVLPTGASTEATLAEISGQLPSTIGQKNKNNSLSVTLATNQDPIDVIGPLTDIQLRAAPVPVSGSVAVSGSVGVTGPLTDTQLRASAVAITGTVAAVTGGLTDTQLRAAAVPVTGTLTDTQLRATPVPVSGPLTDTQLRATAVPISVASIPSHNVTNAGAFAVQATSVALPAGASTEATLAGMSGKLPATLGQKLMAASTSVCLASDQTILPVSVGSLPLPGGAATETTLAALLLKFPGAPGQTTMAGSLAVTIASNQSTLPVSGPQTDAQLRGFCVTNWVTATAAVNNSVTCTLPAAGVGLFHYITSIRVSKLYAAVGSANAAGVVITSSNLPGSPSWLTEQAAGALGTCIKVVDEVPGLPIRSLAANANTTIICPAQAQSIWRINVQYYTGP